MNKENHIYQGNALEVLKTLPDKSINMCMTSPPYWALRDYGVEKQLGLEPTFKEYIKRLCNIFDEVKRILKENGTCWVNLGDTYNAGGNYRGKELGDGSKEVYRRKDFEGYKNDKDSQGIPAKSLCNIPARFSIEMQNKGWILRNEVIWHKPNCMPSSIKDIFTVDFEKIFFFVKNKKYYFNQQFEPHLTNEGRPHGAVREREKGYDSKYNKIHYKNYTVRQKRGGNKNPDYRDPRGKNKRTIWKINTKPYKEAHFAVYPEELCETPIKAGCPEGGTVLDPFFGAGTTGLVALKQNKKFIGIELNPEYIEIANKRLKPYIEQTSLIRDTEKGSI